MPNWCENSVYFSGSEKDIAKLKALIGDKFDFNKVLPMPKEIPDDNVGKTAGNTIVVVNSRSGIFHTYDSKCRKDRLNFNGMWALKMEGGHSAADAINNGHRACKNCMIAPRMIGSDFDRPLEVGAALVKKYGSDNWYDWKIANWGTKWDIEAGVDFGDDWASSDFLSAWGPPRGIYTALKEQFPNLKITWHYSESGNGFSGDLDTGVENDFADPCECDDPGCSECSEEVINEST